MKVAELAALLLFGLVACAPAQRAPDAAAPVEAAHPAEDAGPYWPEDEVDVPARPVDPIVGVYPPGLRSLGIEGEVEARVAVLPDGSVAAARLVSSTHDAFTEAARAAIAAARFHPALRDGRPVASWVGVRLRFRLED
jgi:TonB family protein